MEDEIILYQLKESVLQFLKDEGANPKFNVLTHQVLKMGRKLAKFEILGIACSSSKEGFCILSPKHELFSYKNMDLIRLLKVVKPLLFYGFDGNLIKSAKTIPKKEKKNQESFESLLNKLLNEANSLGDPVVRYSDNLRNYLRSYITNNEFTDEERSFENKCKTEILQLLHYVMD